MVVLCVLAAVAFAGLVWSLVRMVMERRGGGGGGGGGRTDEPEGILKRRYANGEIDRDVYGQALDDLRGQAAPGRSAPIEAPAT